MYNCDGCMVYLYLAARFTPTNAAVTVQYAW